MPVAEMADLDGLQRPAGVVQRQRRLTDVAGDLGDLVVAQRPVLGRADQAPVVGRPEGGGQHLGVLVR